MKSLSYKKAILLVIGIVAAAAIYVMPLHEGLDAAGRSALAVFVLSIVLWLTHVIPLAATGLLAIALLALTGVMEPARAFSHFGNSAVFFLIGVFLLTAAMIRTGLSKRLTLLFLERFDRSPRFLLFGVLFTCSFLALWMPEHAVAAMIFPVVLETVGILGLERGRSSYAKAIFIALAWGSIIGGVGTFLGGARAPLAVGLLHDAYGVRVGFLEWMVAALPVVIIMTPLAYVVLLATFRIDITDVRPAREYLERELARLGRMSGAETRMAALMLCTVAGWILLGKKYDLATISMLAAVMIFVLRIAKWPDLEEYVNWGVIVMYGGAIALGNGLTETGALVWVVERYLPIAAWPPMAVLAFIVFVAIFLTEGISNAATVAVLIPLGFGLGDALGLNPLLVTMAVTVPAGLPFCMPIGSPPNAISFSSGYYEVSEIARRGVWLNLIAVAVMMLVIKFYWPLLGLFD